MRLHGQVPVWACRGLPSQQWKAQCGGQAQSLRAEGGPGFRGDGAEVSTGQKEGKGMWEHRARIPGASRPEAGQGRGEGRHSLPKVIQLTSGRHRIIATSTYHAPSARFSDLHAPASSVLTAIL